MPDLRGAGDFGGLLRRHRRAAKLTQAALAEAAGVSEQAVGRLERGGRRRPYRSTVLALSVALGLGPEATAGLLLAAGGQEAGEDTGMAASDRAPRQLPPDVADFVGRSDELLLLADILSADRPGPKVVVLHGLAGVGKTTLAIHAAHLGTSAFPDGQLYIDLQGYGPGGALTASTALRVLLVSLGVPEQSVPLDLDETAALYRSLLAGTRTLVVLDNASEAEVLKVLLPDDNRCAVLVTGRRALNLPDTVTDLPVSPLDDDDGLRMLGRIIGSERLDAEAEAARTIIRTSHGLPLIVRLVGARLDYRHDWELAQVAHQIAGAGIDHLGVTTAVHATVASSLEHLLSFPDGTERQAAAAFDLLGLIDSAELSQAAVSALLDLTAQQTETVMEHLVDLHLVGSPRPGVYRLHDLLRAVAGERVLPNIGSEERRAALRRVIDLYLTAAWQCITLTHPSSDRLGYARVPVGHVDPATLPERLAWLDSERGAVVALVKQLETLGEEFAASLVELGFALFGYFDVRARWPESREVAITCRRVATDRADQAWFEYSAGIADWQQDHFEVAIERFAAGLTLSEQVGDARGVARCAYATAVALDRLGRYDEAIHWAERTITASRESGYTYGLGAGLLSLGTLHTRRDRMAEAEACFEAAIDLVREAGDIRAVARRHGMAGDSYAAAGSHRQAIPHLRASLEIYETEPALACSAFLHRRLGASLLACGEPDEAAEVFDVGLQLARETANPREEAKLLSEFAELQLSRGRPDVAVEQLTAAAALFDDLGMPEASGARERLAAFTQK